MQFAEPPCSHWWFLTDPVSTLFAEWQISSCGIPSTFTSWPSALSFFTIHLSTYHCYKLMSPYFGVISNSLLYYFGAQILCQMWLVGALSNWFSWHASTVFYKGFPYILVLHDPPGSSDIHSVSPGISHFLRPSCSFCWGMEVEIKLWGPGAHYYWGTLLLGLPCGLAGKESACNAGHLVWSLGWEDHSEKGMATHSSILAWRIPRTIQSMGLQRAGYDWADMTSPCFLAVSSDSPEK